MILNYEKKTCQTIDEQTFETYKKHYDHKVSFIFGIHFLYSELKIKKKRQLERFLWCCVLKIMALYPVCAGVCVMGYVCVCVDRQQ